MRRQSTDWPRRAGVGALVLLTTFISGACGGRAPVSPSVDSASAAPPTSSVQSARYYVSGRVTDETGQGIAGSLVELRHGASLLSSFTSSCSGGAVCYVATQTDGNGNYSMEVEAVPLRNVPGIDYSIAPGIGYLNAWGIYPREWDVQWVPAGGPLIVQNLTLRDRHTIRAGESSSVFVTPTSSLCADAEGDLQRFDSRCEVVHVESPEGTLDIDVHTEDGAPAPLLFWQTWSWLGTVTRPSPTTVQMTVGKGTFTIYIGIPQDSGPTRFEIATSWH